MSNDRTPHEIEIEIDEEGGIKATVKGVDGPDCSRLSKWLDQLGRVVVDQPTADHRKAARPQGRAQARTGR